MEGGEGKHLSSVRHLLPQMTQSDCRESRMERSPFTITVAPVGSFPPRSLLSRRLCPRPRRCRLAVSLLSDEPPQHHQICSHNHPPEQGWEGSWWGGLAEGSELPSETVRNAAEDVIATLLPPDASKRSTKARCARSDQMSAAAVMLPLALTGSRRAGRPAVRRQAETGGGRRRRRRCEEESV